MLEFLGNLTPWAALIGLVLGAVFTYKVHKKALLWPVLGFGLFWIAVGLAGFGVLPWIGTDLGAIFKLLAGFAFGWWIPLALVWFFKEGMAGFKKIIK